MYLGIEIGGTKLQLGVGDGYGTLVGLRRAAIDPAQGADGIRRQITDGLPELLAQVAVDRSRLRGVGIGFGGPVDDATRTVIKSHQIEGWDNFPLADWISELVGLPAALGNDADVAGLAEALFGAGKGLSPIFYITIGSGIGGGLIINGEIYRGVGRGAAEIGHLRMWGPMSWSLESYADAASIGYKRLEMAPRLEDLASGWALGRQAREAAQQYFHHDSELFRLVCGQINRIEGKHVGQAAVKHDLLALGIVELAVSNLGHAIANVIALLSPRRIVIGGGVSLLGERLFFERVRVHVAQSVFEPFAKCYDIVPAALGEEVVVHGALALARKQLGERGVSAP